jgi:hypothetical protein
VNQQKKLIILLVLMGGLGLAAFYMFVLGGGKKKRKKPKATDQTEESISVLLPDAAELAQLRNWFIKSPTEEFVAKCPVRGVFGLDGLLGSDDPLAGVAVTGNPELTPKAQFVEPPELQMLIGTSSSPKAVFDGESYGKGDTVRNTSFKIIEISKDSVTLKGEDGQKVTLDLRN